MQVRRMTKEDCAAVAAIEAVSFSMPWSLRAFTDTVEIRVPFSSLKVTSNSLVHLAVTVRFPVTGASKS